MQEARDQADHGPRGLLRGRPQDRGGQVRAQPPDAGGPERPGLPQPGQAHVRRLPGGLQARQGQRGHGAALAVLRGRDRPDRLPGLALLPAAGRGQPPRGPRPRRRAAAGLRLRQRLLRGPEERDRAPGQGQRGHRGHRPRGRPAGGGHGRRALPGPRGLPQPLGAAVRADQEHAGRAEDVLRHQRVLPQGHRRDDGRVLGLARGGAHHAGDRRALQRGHRARQHAHPQLRDAGRPPRGRLPARPGPGRAARALRRSHPGRGHGAAGHGARGHRADGLRRLLPDRLGLRQVRQGQRHRRGPGPWLGGRLAGVLRAGHHRGRPAQVRPAVRALPEPRARVHAGHRHRLLGQGPRPGHALRREQVRARVGGPDRDLRQDAAAQRHPRRGAGARQGLRGRRPAGQAHPRAGHGPLAVAGQVPGRGRRAQEGLRHRRRGARGHRHRPRARGHRAQRRRPRRRGGHRRPAAHRHRAAAADGGPRRRVRGRRARLQGHHPVLHGPDRGAGPAQDGLPGPAQPGRHRELPGHHRRGRGRAARHGRRCRWTTPRPTR